MPETIIPIAAVLAAQEAALTEWNKGGTDTARMLAALRAGLAAAYPLVAKQILVEHAILWDVDCPRCAARLAHAYAERMEGAREALRDGNRYWLGEADKAETVAGRTVALVIADAFLAELHKIDGDEKEADDG